MTTSPSPPFCFMLPAGSLRAVLAGGALALSWLFVGAPTASAQHLMVGGPDTLIRRTLPVTDDFDIVGACGGIVESMVAVGDLTYIGDSTGILYVHDPAVGVVYSFNSGNDATALASDGQRLFVGGSDGSIESYDLVSEALLDVWRGPAGLRALAIVGTDLYAAGDGGVITRTLVQGSGVSESFVDVGMPISAMTPDMNALLVGSSSGTVVRVEVATQQVSATFTAGSDITALGMSLDQLLVASGDGTVRRVDSGDGTLLDVMSVGSSVRALALTDGVPPAFSYCYGVQCPCGNDDPLAGCENSLGRGARLVAAGTSSAGADDLALFMTSTPPLTTAVAFVGQSFGSGNFGDGILCIGGSAGLQRFAPMQTSVHGSLVIDGIRQRAEAEFGAAFQVITGADLHFQVWYRDALSPCGASSNATNSARVIFTP